VKYGEHSNKFLFQPLPLPGLPDRNVAAENHCFIISIILQKNLENWQTHGINHAVNALLMKLIVARHTSVLVSVGYKNPQSRR